MEISEGLARNVLSATVNDEVWDLNRPIYEDCNIKLNTWLMLMGNLVFGILQHIYLQKRLNFLPWHTIWNWSFN